MYALTFPSYWAFFSGLMNYSACNVQCYCVVRAKTPYSKKLAWCLMCPEPYLLLHTVE